MTATRTAAQIARDAGRPMPQRTPIGGGGTMTAADRRACNAPDDSPDAYPPAKPSKLTIRKAASL